MKALLVYMYRYCMSISVLSVLLHSIIYIHHVTLLGHSTLLATYMLMHMLMHMLMYTILQHKATELRTGITHCMICCQHVAMSKIIQTYRHICTCICASHAVYMNDTCANNLFASRYIK